MRKALYILGELNDLDLDWMVEHGKLRQVRAREVVIRQNEPLQWMFLTLRGLFSVTDQKLDNRELARLGAGEIIGEMSFVEARPPTATVTAIEDGLVLALGRDALAAKLQADTGFAARFYRALAVFLSDRVRATVQRLGYGSTTAAVDEDALQDDELDLNVLDKVHLAGQRFDDLLKRLGG